jgi:hypothetical protein
VSYKQRPIDCPGTPELERCRRASHSSHVVAGGRVALSSLVPYSLKCDRTSGPSHFDDGGGDALQGISIPMGDRSGPVQSERFRAGGGPSQCWRHFWRILAEAFIILAAIMTMSSSRV